MADTVRSRKFSLKMLGYSAFLIKLHFSVFTNENGNCDHIEWFTSKSHEIKNIAIIILYFLCLKNISVKNFPQFLLSFFQKLS